MTLLECRVHMLSLPTIRHVIGMLVAILLFVTTTNLHYNRTALTGILPYRSTTHKQETTNSKIDVKPAIFQLSHGQHAVVNNQSKYALIVSTPCLVILAGKQSDTRYAVFSANWDGDSYRYSFMLPLTTMAWRRIGYGSVVLIVGNLQNWRNNPTRNYILESTLEKGAIVVFLQGAPAVNSVMLSQISRLLAAAFVPFNSKLNLVLLTTDADIWPGNETAYELPSKLVSIKVTNAFCCGKFNHKGTSYQMYPMTNIIANLTTWRMMIRRHISTISCANDIVTYAKREFGSIATRVVHKGGNDGWYMDQHIASIWIADWNRHHNSVSYVGRYCRKDRIDRIRWAHSMVLSMRIY